ncbi:MAG: hypothetical protein O6945_04965 [Gammaproteobacteria bacterium]|nr:hypothetical protein [Gammaproteobacteria bacterium]
MSQAIKDVLAEHRRQQIPHTITVITKISGWPWLDRSRETLVQFAALIIGEIEQRDSRKCGVQREIES